MAKGARWKADVVRKFAVRREAREPVNSLRGHETLHAAAVGGHPGQLRVTGVAPELLSVEVQPSTVGRIFGAVDMVAASLRIASFAAFERYECEPTGNRQISARELDEGQRPPIRADTVEEVIAARFVRNPLRGAALDWRSGDVGAVGRQINQAPL